MGDRSAVDAIVERLRQRMRVVKVSLFGTEAPPSFRLGCEQTAAYLARQWLTGNLQRAATGAHALPLQSCPLTPGCQEQEEHSSNSKIGSYASIAMTTPAALGICASGPPCYQSRVATWQRLVHCPLSYSALSHGECLCHCLPDLT